MDYNYYRKRGLMEIKCVVEKIDRDVNEIMNLKYPYLPEKYFKKYLENEDKFSKLGIIINDYLEKILSLENAMEALDEYVNGMGQYTENSIGKIINVVSEYFKLTPDDLKGKKRSKNIANARMIAMYLCRVLTDETYPRIGLEFGGRDHSTVIHGYDKINDDMKSNGELEKMISELKQKMSE